MTQIAKISLLEKHSDKLVSKSEVENIRVKLTEVYVVAGGVRTDGTRWRKLGYNTDKGTFYGFDDTLHGITVDAFIPESGYDASMSIRENTYTDKDGVEQTNIEVKSCKVATVDATKLGIMQAAAAQGIALNLFS